MTDVEPFVHITKVVKSKPFAVAVWIVTELEIYGTLIYGILPLSLGF
jgi:hypothetical protein